MFVTPKGNVLWLRKPPYQGKPGEWVLPGGKVEAGEHPAQAAAREAQEELGYVPEGPMTLLHRATTTRGVDYSTFLKPVDGEFQVVIDDEHTGWCWAPLDAPPEPTHPGILAMMGELRAVAADMAATTSANAALPLAGKRRAEDAYALDRATVRTTDADGHLHVASSVVSAAQVNDYMAEEIPGWEQLGLQRGRIYALLRDPVELERAVQTWHGKPLLIVHRGQTADDHDREVTVGSVSNPVWEYPNLRAELTVWDGEAITGIENGTMKDLSSGYRYTPVMEPGEFQGVHYDGRMTEIQANHVAIVKQGRVIGAFVGDSAPDFDALWEKIEMALDAGEESEVKVSSGDYDRMKVGQVYYVDGARQEVLKKLPENRLRVKRLPRRNEAKAPARDKAMDAATETDRAWGRLARALGMDANTELETARREYETIRSLFRAGKVTAGQLDRAKEKYEKLWEENEKSKK